MIAAILKGLALGLMLSITVGPIVFSILKQSINNGQKGGFAFITGVAASDVLLVTVSNIFTELFSDLLQYKTAIGVGGSLLLIAIGVYVTFFKKITVNEAGRQIIQMSKRDYVHVALAGFLMNILNPTVIGFWLLTSTSLLTQTLQYRLVVFVTCLSIVILFDVMKVLLAGKIRSKLTPQNIHIINRISGIILIGFGLALIWGIFAFGDQVK